MIPASYVTGMEICTLLSCRVEGNSSLSLWEKRHKNQRRLTKTRVKTLEVELRLTPRRCHVDLDIFLDVLGIGLEFDLEAFLQARDHVRC